MISRFLDWVAPRRSGRGKAAQPGAEGTQAQSDLDTIIPIFELRMALDNDSEGPFIPIEGSPFGVAWATMPGPNRFLLVTHEQAAYWDDIGLDWQGAAMANLARASEGEHWYGTKADEEGRTFIVSLLVQDSFGPSRLLLPHFFDELLGPGYRVAIPELTCAVAYRAELNEEERFDIDGAIDGCFRLGTNPMSPERFNAEDFWIFGDRHSTDTEEKR